VYARRIIKKSRIGDENLHLTSASETLSSARPSSFGAMQESREESGERGDLNDFSSKQVLRYHGEALPDRLLRFHRRRAIAAFGYLWLYVSYP